MKAAVVRRPGGSFELTELADPEPRGGEILVRVAACGVCHTDLHIRDGAIPFPMPCVLGHELSGTVVAVGDGVDALAPGDRVAGAFIMPCGDCRMCTSGREELCMRFFEHNRLAGTLYDGETRLFDRAGNPVWMYSMGGLSELAVMPALAAARVPDTLDLTDSAIFGCALLTAYGAVRHVAALEPGETVAVIGVGGVGAAVVQLARALGAARVIAVDLADDKLERATALGATDAIDASKGDAAARLRASTDGRGADVVFEVIGNPATFRAATEMAADGGRCVMVGLAAAGRTAEVEITRLVRRKLQILGSFGGRPRHDLPILMEMAARGQLDIGGAITRRFPLEQADHAYAELEAGRIAGRAVVEIAGR